MQEPGGTNSQLVLIGPDGKRLPSIAQPVGASGGPMLIGRDGRAMSAPSAETASAALFPAPGAIEGYGSPAGGLFSTGEDMQKFAEALLQNKLLSRATMIEFTAAQIESAPAADGRPARHYGFGFGVTDEGGARWVGHNGGTLGANAEFAMEPQDQWVVSVLSNRDPPGATVLMRRIKALIADPKQIASCR